MNKFFVYLAGPITGLNYKGATDWRELAKKHLYQISEGQIEGLSPMRHKDYLSKETDLAALGYDDTVLSSQRGITARDRFDCKRSDLVIFNMLGAERVSIGTCIELGWADDGKKPLILVMEEEKNIHEHAMVREICQFRVKTVEEAIILAYKILVP